MRGRRAGLKWAALAGFVALCLVALVIGVGPPGWARGPAPPKTVEAAQLPREAQATLALIRRGGPYRYRQDGSTFGNRERLLPAQPRDYYREYTVPTPGARDRGARRIVAGGRPPVVFYYTADHYRSFQKIGE